MTDGDRGVAELLDRAYPAATRPGGDWEAVLESARSRSAAWWTRRLALAALSVSAALIVLAVFWPFESSSGTSQGLGSSSASCGRTGDWNRAACRSRAVFSRPMRLPCRDSGAATATRFSAGRLASSARPRFARQAPSVGGSLESPAHLGLSEREVAAWQREGVEPVPDQVDAGNDERECPPARTSVMSWNLHGSPDQERERAGCRNEHEQREPAAAAHRLAQHDPQPEKGDERRPRVRLTSGARSRRPV